MGNLKNHGDLTMSKYKYEQFVAPGQLKAMTKDALGVRKTMFAVSKLNHLNSEQKNNALYSAVRDLGGDQNHPIVKALESHMRNTTNAEIVQDVIKQAQAFIQEQAQGQTIASKETSRQQVGEKEKLSKQKAEQQSLAQSAQPIVKSSKKKTPEALSINPGDYMLVSVTSEHKQLTVEKAKKDPDNFAKYLLENRGRKGRANIVFSVFVESNIDVIKALTDYAVKKDIFTAADLDNIRQAAAAEIELRRIKQLELIQRGEQEIERAFEKLGKVGVESQGPEARDSIIFGLQNDQAKTLTSSGDIDLITEAIRKEILVKQQKMLQEEIGATTPAIKGLDHQKFMEYLLATQEGKDAAAKVFAKPVIQMNLNRIEVEGYKAVHSQFKNSFSNINWVTEQVQGATTASKTKSCEIKNKDGQPVVTIKEITHDIVPTIVELGDSRKVSVVSYRTIDFPKGLETGKGPLHLSMAAKDINGKNISEKDAVYFTAHYDANGKLTEVSSPIPMKFMGKGDDAVGYIERNGEVYTMPVTQGKYKEMMKEVAKNKGMGIDLSQEIAQEVQDLVKTKGKTVILPLLEKGEQTLQSKKQTERSDNSISLPKQEPLPLKMISTQGLSNTEKAEKIDDMLRGATPEQIVATLKDQLTKGGSEAVELIVEATKSDRTGNHFDVPKLTAEQFKQVYDIGMHKASPSAKSHVVQGNIHKASAKLCLPAGVDYRYHINLVKFNTTQLTRKQEHIR